MRPGLMSPGKFHMTTRGMPRQQASMRPGLMSPGKFCRPRGSERRRRCFNEAGADEPRKMACRVKATRHGMRFNEAGADEPRKIDPSLRQAASTCLPACANGLAICHSFLACLSLHSMEHPSIYSIFKEPFSCERPPCQAKHAGARVAPAFRTIRSRPPAGAVQRVCPETAPPG